MLQVTKRDGRTESLDLEKIHRVITCAVEGLHNVSVSQVELKAQIQFYNCIKTTDIHGTIIKSAAADYQYLAARLAIFLLRKKAYGQFEPPALYQQVQRLVELGKYDAQLLQDYTAPEFAQMDQMLDHWRNMQFSYAAEKQLEGKYLEQNRISGEIYESPQFLYLLIAACLFAHYPKAERIDYIQRFYDATSQ